MEICCKVCGVITYISPVSDLPTGWEVEYGDDNLDTYLCNIHA